MRDCTTGRSNTLLRQLQQKPECNERKRTILWVDPILVVRHMPTKFPFRLILALAEISFLAGCGKVSKTDQSPEENSSVVVKSGNPTEVEQPTADEKPLEVSAVSNEPDPAAEAERVNRLQQDLMSAVAQGDLEKLKESLASGAQPDWSQGTNATPIRIAGMLASRPEQTGNSEAMEIFLELSRYIRHRDGERVEMEGRLVTIVPRQGGNLLAIEPPDGVDHYISISMAETRYINIAPADNCLDMITDEGRYRVVGYQKGESVIEVEELKLLYTPPPQVRHTHFGFHFPVPLLLNSTDARLSLSALN